MKLLSTNKVFRFWMLDYFVGYLNLWSFPCSAEESFLVNLEIFCLSQPPPLVNYLFSMKSSALRALSKFALSIFWEFSHGSMVNELSWYINTYICIHIYINLFFLSVTGPFVSSFNEQSARNDPQFSEWSPRPNWQVSAGVCGQDMVCKTTRVLWRIWQ